MIENCNSIHNFEENENLFYEVKNSFDNLIQFVKGYNEIESAHTARLQAYVQRNSIEKIFSLKGSIVSFLAKKFSQLIETQVGAIEISTDQIQSLIEQHSKSAEEAEILQKKSKVIFEDFKRSLEEKYKKVEKLKSIFFSDASTAEDWVIRNRKVRKNSGATEAEKADIKKSAEEALRKMSVSEKNYRQCIEEGKNFKEKFEGNLKEADNTTTKLGKDILGSFYELVFQFYIGLKNRGKMIDSTLEIHLPGILNYKSEEKYDEYLSKHRLNNEEEQILKKPPEVYQIKTLKLFKEVNNIKSNNEDDPNYFNNNYLISNSVVQENNVSLSFEDVHYVIKEMMKVLIGKPTDYNVQVEENKIFINKMCGKVLIKEESTLTDEEVEKLIETLNGSVYRKFFLQKLNDLRSRGVFKLHKKNYEIIGKILNDFLDKMSKEEDWYSAKNIIILSQTFYYQENENLEKRYLQYLIQENPLLKSQGFWETFVTYSITNEIEDSLKNDKNNGSIYKENEKDSNHKYSNIVFAQLIAITDNMVEFGLEKSIIKNILFFFTTRYKLSEQNVEMITQILEKNEKKAEP